MSRPLSQFIAVKGLTNTMGIGIVAMDLTNDELVVEVYDGDTYLSGGAVRLSYYYNDEIQDYEKGFYWYNQFHKVEDFIRVDY